MSIFSTAFARKLPGFTTVATKIGLPGFRNEPKEVEAPVVAPAATLMPGPPPSAAVAASNAVTQARLASERQRKRAAGGNPKLTTQPVGPKAILQPKTLIGGY